ncbi:BQ2448_1120 [Microbotryum intermedium]|uniref:BQ2448_1120 protein n=1 Tax=Microbotryum intermedium TaxID=269621 RepID=A0A238FF65_9BASI|nr:BQ2448_1120 [Microbotryum intermedium]
MAYNPGNGSNQFFAPPPLLHQQRSMSPGQLSQLRAPIRTTSNPPSPLTVGGGFAFPGPPGPSNLSASTPASGSPTLSSESYFDGPNSSQSGPYQGTSRFHQAFAASRHASSSSVSSDKSFTFANPGFDDGTSSPTRDRTFDMLHRELVGGGQNGWNSEAPDSRGPSPRFNGTGPGGAWGLAARGGRVFAEPLDAYDGMSSEATVRRGSENARAASNGLSQATMNAVEAMPSADFGRPASMIYDGGEGEAGFDFLLSPPQTGFQSDRSATFPTTAPRSTSFGANLNSQGLGDATPKAKDWSRDRTFPAPLLLKTNRSRPFAPPTANPAFPAAGQAPQPRRPSTSAGSYSASSVPTLTTSLPVNTPGATSYAAARPGVAAVDPSPGNAPLSRSAFPYQRHRPSASSTSSISHAPSQLSMTHSPNGSGGSSSTTAPPSLSSSLSNLPSQMPPLTSSTSAPLLPALATQATTTTSSDPPIAPQALLSHVKSLRSPSSSPHTSISPQLSLTRSTTAPLGTVLSSSTAPPEFGATHQRITSTGSTGSDGALAASRERLSQSPTRSIVRPSTAPSQGSPSSKTTPVKLETVDLSHKRIAEIPQEVIDELRGEVEKLALGYNLLKDLPSQFSSLGNRLRYLNVRVNMLTVFPQVVSCRKTKRMLSNLCAWLIESLVLQLCEMPSLEILDISRNKIKRLPASPGTLVNLKVFSIAKNRVKRLPIWFSALTHLKVLKVDHNPLEWPPKDVAAFPSSSTTGTGSNSKIEDAEEMQRWLPMLLKWIRDNSSAEAIRVLEKSAVEEKRRRPSVITSEDDERSFDSSLSGSNAPGLIRTPAMTRTESGRLVLGGSVTSALGARPRVTPPSTSAGLRNTSSTDERRASKVMDGDESSVRHGRNASHSTTQTLQSNGRSDLRGKKSLPDLRQSHADILADRRTATTMLESEAQATAAVVAAAGAGAALRRLNMDRTIPGTSQPRPNRAALLNRSRLEDSNRDLGFLDSAVANSRSLYARPGPIFTHGATRSGDNESTPLASPLGYDVETPRTRAMRTGHAIDPRGIDGLDRNSGAYFRRLSMLPASSISKAVPANLLNFADAIRGLLFALSQIYSALRQFVVFASQDRFPAPIARLMSAADESMSDLINALDRFDSLSRRAAPSSEIVRNIFTSCRENVATFHELVQALGPHLGALIGTADVRYTRTLLLMLYGSTGEIATSWTAVASMLSGMANIIDDPSLSTPMLSTSPGPTHSTNSSASSRLLVPGSTALSRIRSKSRRHAGSFSVEDVQLGAELAPSPVQESQPFPAEPSNGMLSASSSTSTLGTSTGGSGNNATVRALNRKGLRPIGGITVPLAQGYREMVNDAFKNPMTPGQTRDLLLEGNAPSLPAIDTNFNLSNSAPLNANSLASAGPGSSSEALANLNSSSSSMKTLSSVSHGRGTESFSLPRSEGGRPVSTANADATFVDMAESTVTIARSIYGMLLDAFDASDPSSAPVDDDGARLMRALGPRKVQELADLCRMGNEATSELRSALARVRSPDSRGPLKFTPADAKKLGDDAYAFVQTVIRFAKLVKAISLEHGFAPRIREGVGQLTIATREFAKTLSNSSFNLRETRGQKSIQSKS